MQHQTPNSRTNGVKWPLLWLAMVAFVLYIPSLFFGITRLDDYVLVYKLSHYYEHYSNLLTSFRRGVFGYNDHYYRPLLLNSFLLNYKLTYTDLVYMHLVNVLLHAAATCLLFILFIQLRISKINSFFLGLFFAVHPVLVQAVSWLPGRNDTLLAVFVFSFFISATKYIHSKKWPYALLSAVFLTLSLFTKETGLFAVPAWFCLYTGFQHKQLNNKRNWPLYIAWVLPYAVWAVARYSASVHAFPISPGLVARTGTNRIPLLVQYTGKIFFPTNLSVFPSVKDTALWPGLIALPFIGLFLYLSPNPNKRKIASGAGIFLLFLVPALIVPDYMSIQAFEHRLYLPLAGALLVFSQFMIFSSKVSTRLLYGALLPIIIFFAGINLAHQRSFANPLKFWTQAVATSPSSAYAHALLALQQKDANIAFATMQLAEKLNPEEHHINYYKGLLYLKFDSLAASQRSFELEQQKSGYNECSFQLARVAYRNGNWQLAGHLYSNYLKTNPNRSKGESERFSTQFANDTIQLKLFLKKSLN